MTLLIIGIAIFTLTHFYKSLLPNGRMSITNRFGEGPAKGLIAAAMFVGIVLMVIGYRAAPFEPVYTPMAGIGHFSLILLYVAMVMMGMGNSKGRMRSWLRHPMLTAVIVWATAHLLVNGDIASLILFGGLGLWAILHIFILNATQGPWQRPEPGEFKGDIKLLIIGAVIFALIASIHLALGINPFAGTHA